MLIRTHLLISIFFSLIFFPFFENKILFFAVVLIATFLPDIDSSHSKLGKNKLFRPLQFFLGHRGILHSFTFLFMITALIFFFSLEISVAFLLGYGLHLLADSLNVKGITPFYPLGKKWAGKVRTGSWLETIIFVCVFLADLALFYFRVSSFFS